MYKKILQILLIISFLSCSTSKETTNTLQSIKFGNGGGITGQVTEYTINESGCVFLSASPTDESNKIGCFSSSEMKDIHKNLEETDLSSINLNEPGNIYYFIELIYDKNSHKIVWGKNNQAPPQPVKDTYKYLNDKINTIQKHD